MIPAHLIVGAPTAPYTAFVIHGALGAGNNFRSFTNRLAQQKPAWRFVLVDLRHHGRSQGASPPNTLEACVDDLLELSTALETPPTAVIGHSLGGKVALAYGRSLTRRAAAPELEPARQALQQIWALDSNPGAQKPDPDHQVLRVVNALRSLPGPFERRETVVEALTTQHGFSSGLAQWLITNLERRADRFAWQFDLEAIGELLDDYFQQDLWPYLEASRGLPEHHLVVAERSDRWTGSMRQQVRELPAESAVSLHELPNSGHWVHVDNPEGLLQILGQHLTVVS